MNNIHSRFLKAELITLFLLTAVTFVAFYYQDVLPDNMFTITSEQNESSFILYYFSSFINVVGYYTGPWVFFPFFIYALCYAFLYSRRENATDHLNALTLILSFLIWTYIAEPLFLGKGLRYLMNEYVSTVALVLMSILFPIGFLFGTFRGSFKDSMIGIYNFLLRVPYHFKEFFRMISPARFTQKLRRLNSKVFSRSKVRVPSLLRRNDNDQEIQKKTRPEDFPVRVDSKETPMDYFEQETNVDGTEDVQAQSLNEEPLIQEINKVNPDYEQKKAAYKKKRTAHSDKKYYEIVTTLQKTRKFTDDNSPDDTYFNDIVDRIEEKLQEFNIDGEIINILKGPVVDTFELKLGAGVRVSKVRGISEDLSMALMGAPIRVVYPMIGKETVGVEVPRNPREIIYLEEVLNSSEFQNSKNLLPIAMGKNAFGETFVSDLAGMPHMLVAGATGAGKSVFINTLLVSLLVKKSPSQMKLILIDPKQLELALYSKLPHLVMPVLTDAKRASIALMWACEEMERRYSILKEFGVRNIEGFNQKLLKATPDMLGRINQYYENEPGDEYKLPYLVIIVDEFADLILTKAGKEIENNICRLAAKARAAGIHLVLATQRPSVDVITGLIKSNFPTRVSFRVTSPVDSRTILSTQGAELLLGKGDMLYKHGTNTVRVHSSYVDEVEIEALTEKLSEMDMDFHPQAVDFLENGGPDETDPYSFGSHITPVSTDGSDDDLYKQAVNIVVETRAASASFLQRRLKIGYNRAARLIEEMESKGVVGPAEGSKRRKVLVGPEA